MHQEDYESIHSSVAVEFILCSCVAVAVGALACWHVMLISRGETSVEVYVNRNMSKKMKKEGKVCVVPNAWFYCQLFFLIHGSLYSFILHTVHLILLIEMLIEC